MVQGEDKKICMYIRVCVCGYNCVYELGQERNVENWGRRATERERDRQSETVCVGQEAQKKKEQERGR